MQTRVPCSPKARVAACVAAGPHGACMAAQSLALAHADVTDNTVFFSPWCALIGCQRVYTLTGFQRVSA